MSGCYGDSLVETPAIDSFAAGGAAYTPSLLSAAWAARMTGCHVHRIEVWDNAAPLRSDWPTFAHSFGGARSCAARCTSPAPINCTASGNAERRTSTRGTSAGRPRTATACGVPPKGTGRASTVCTRAASAGRATWTRTKRRRSGRCRASAASGREPTAYPCS